MRNLKRSTFGILYNSPMSSIVLLPMLGACGLVVVPAIAMVGWNSQEDASVVGFPHESAWYEIRDLSIRL